MSPELQRRGVVSPPGGETNAARLLGGSLIDSTGGGRAGETLERMTVGARGPPPKAHTLPLINRRAMPTNTPAYGK